ncbi:hypothetical protein ACOSP7_023483 [Xanthoceras sorbifolium]
MLSFRIYVKYVNQCCDLHVIEPGDCSVTSIINDAKKLFGCHLKQGQHVLKTDEELMTTFELFDKRNFSSIEFELQVMPIAVEFLDEPVGLLHYNLDPNNDHGIPRPNNLELEDFDTDFQSDDVSSEASYVSIVDDDVNGDHAIAKYCAQNQWVPNDDGSIEFRPGKIFGNVKLVRETVKKYAIQEGFHLKRIKNDRHRFIAMCNNEACDWKTKQSCNCVRRVRPPYLVGFVLLICRQASSSPERQSNGDQS